MKEESEGSGLLTEGQKVWVETMKLMLSTGPARRPIPPPNRFRHSVFRMVTSTRFEFVIMGLICVNTCILAAYHYPISTDAKLFQEYANWVFVVVFAVEALLKIFALGPIQYLQGGWNRFDASLVVLSIIGAFVNLGKYATLMRIIRVARIFRLVRTSKRLMELFKTLLYSVPSLVNVGAILLLVYFIFAIMGMNLFSSVKHGQLLGPHANFSSFWLSFLTLFRCSTGESFNGLMHDVMIQEPFCDPNTNCGFPTIAPLFFVTFFMLTSQVLLNLLIAIILDNFGDTVKLGNAAVTDEHIDAFKEEWAKHGTDYIPATSLRRLILNLEYPLGLKNAPGVKHSESLNRQCRKIIKELAIPVRDGKIHFQETLGRLAARAHGSAHGEELDLEDERIIAMSGGRKLAPPTRSQRGVRKKEVVVVESGEYDAAISIQAMLRGRQQRRNLAKQGHRVITPRAAASPEQKRSQSPHGSLGTAAPTSNRSIVEVPPPVHPTVRAGPTGAATVTRAGTSDSLPSASWAQQRASERSGRGDSGAAASPPQQQRALIETADAHDSDDDGDNVLATEELPSEIPGMVIPGAVDSD